MAHKFAITGALFKSLSNWLLLSDWLNPIGLVFSIVWRSKYFQKNYSSWIGKQEGHGLDTCGASTSSSREPCVQFHLNNMDFWFLNEWKHRPPSPCATVFFITAKYSNKSINIPVVIFLKFSNIVCFISILDGGFHCTNAVHMSVSKYVLKSEQKDVYRQELSSM